MDNVKAVSSKKVEIPENVMMLTGSFAFAILITIGAFVYIPLPFTPVPITLQVLFVLLAGLFLGEKYGTISSFLYVLSGFAGLPVFSGAVGGFSRVLGPTGGYLVGFLIAPFVVSFIYRRMGRRTLYAVIAMYAGLSIIYLFGMLHLSVFLKKGFYNAFVLGIFPFVAGDTVKIILASFLIRITRRLI